MFTDFYRIYKKLIIIKNGSVNSLHTKSRDTQGYTRSELDEEHIVGVEQCFMTMDVRVINFEVIHYIREHRPERTNTTFSKKLNTQSSRLFMCIQIQGCILWINPPRQEESCRHAHTCSHGDQVGNDQVALDRDD